MIGGGAIAGYAALADAQTPGTSKTGTMAERSMGPHVQGTITAISGSTITIEGKDGKTYSIDASDATVKSFAQGSEPTEGDVSGLSVGDEIGVRGTIDGTSVVATQIMDGMLKRGMGGHGKGHGVRGEVTAVNGSTITVTGKDGKAYTVNAGSATVQRMTEGSLADITVGDTIGVQGTVSGTSVEATTIMDDVVKPTQ